jgi:hypothetical protein
MEHHAKQGAPTMGGHATAEPTATPLLATWQVPEVNASPSEQVG